MRLVVKYKTRQGKPYRVNAEALSETTCERIALDCSMTALRVAVNLALGMILKGDEGRTYRLEG